MSYRRNHALLAGGRWSRAVATLPLPSIH